MTDKEQLWSSIQSQLSQGGFGTADMIEACVRITDTIHEWFEEYHKERLLLLDVSGSLPLIEVLNDYIRLLGEELDETAGIAAAHGWKSKRIEQGEKLRAKLKDLGNVR